MNFYGISNILTGITSLSLAVFVYIKGYKHRLARIWSFFSLSAAIYGFAAYIVTCAKSASEAFFWWQMSYIGIILLPYLFVLIVYEFLNIKHPFFVKFMGVLTAIFLISDLFFKKLFINNCTLYFKEMPGVTPVYFVYPTGPILFFFIIFAFFGWVFYGIFELLKNYKKVSGLKRNQVKYFIFAAFLGFGGGGTSFLPCFGINAYPYLNFLAPIHFLMISYIILRFRLMDINVAITRTGIFVAVYSFILGIPILLFIRLKDFLISLWGANWWMLPSGLMALSATFGPFIYIFLERKAERRLLAEQRTYQETLRQAAREMARIHSFKKLLNLIAHIVTKTVRISYASIYLFDKDSSKYGLKTSRNLKKFQPPSIENKDALVNWFQKNREPLVYEEISLRAQEKGLRDSSQLEESMRNLNAAVAVPGFLEDKLIGILALGEKRSGKIYSVEDLNTFSLLANQAVLAVENAILYENIEEQVRERTRELVETQKQLIQAEKLATVGTLAGGVAHEINNPLTAILTNVQMLLADKEVDLESLELIEEATKRCRTIVQKLMAYAKKPMETEKISEVNLLEVTKNLAAFLKFQLEQENVKIIIEAKESEYLVTGNQNELEQVITNIILNARDAIRQVKKEGEIHISFLKSGDRVKMKIKDEGAGIAKEIMAKIFDPFFTTKDVGKGTGLGLSICQSIIEKHNGLITVESLSGNGAVFTVQLPKAKKSVQEVAGGKKHFSN